jgi:acetylornithine deacetylase/succinyl-diaminopimelate desuccinylase-like protein
LAAFSETREQIERRTGVTQDPCKVCEKAVEQFADTFEQLKRHVAIPSISCEEAHRADVTRQAEEVRDQLEDLGLTADIRTLSADESALPLVTAEWPGAGEGRPTVLIYGHLDVQPVDAGKWTVTERFVAKERDGRLYGRGASDDKGGWLSHIAGIRAWMDTYGELPCNLKMVLESEEEIGSTNLGGYLDAYEDCFEADYLVLTDCDNRSTEIPALTVSLRGLMEVTITCEALRADVHSGLWGGVVPDVSTALMQLVSRIVDHQGRLVVGDIEVPEEWREDARRYRITEDEIRNGGRLLDDVPPLPEGDRSAAEWMWRQSSVTVIQTSLPNSRVEAKSALRSRASASLSIRIGPTEDNRRYIDDFYAELKRLVTTDVPQGVIVKVERDDTSLVYPWLCDASREPVKAAFAAADRAYRKGWGHRPARVGIGGSIGFVNTFAERFPDVPVLLNGVIDPNSGCHGPDESQDIGVLRKAINTNIHLLHELSKLREEE